MTIGIGGRRLYVCTPDRDDLASFLEAVIVGGVDVVQLRDKDLEARPLLQCARIVREVCSAHGVPFMLNDRPDLALEACADGVHLGRDDAPCALARRLLGPDAIVGHSTHSPEDLDDAVSLPVDYLSAGPVVPTATHPSRAATGLGYLSMAVARSPWPVFVTGGVTPATVRGLVEAGARHFVVVRWLTEAADPGAAASALRRAIDDAIAGAGQD